MQKNVESKKKLLVKVGIVIVFVIVIGIGFIKNKIEENSYNKMYEDIEFENAINVNENMEKAEEVLKEQENKIKVYVTGAVNNAGVVELNEGSRIQDAINLAGGVRDDANLEEVNLAYCLEDGQKLYIPNINEKEVEYLSTENGDKVIEGYKNSDTLKVNINTGGVEELKKLPGVGESLAQKIIDYRNENGKFKTVDDLKNVSGIGEKKFESMSEYLYVK